MGKIHQNWKFKDALKNCGYSSPKNPKTPRVGSHTTKITPSIAFEFLPFKHCKNGKKQPKKTKKWKSAKISLNDAKRSIQIQ